jgi:hypothetical protein
VPPRKTAAVPVPPALCVSRTVCIVLGSKVVSELVELAAEYPPLLAPNVRGSVAPPGPIIEEGRVKVISTLSLFFPVRLN